MRCSHMILVALTAVAVLGAAPDLAAAQSPSSQTSANSASGSTLSAQASQTAADVSKWSRKQWNAAKAKWAQEKDAWNSCQTKATAQNLAGRKSWQFLYDCMTKS